MTARQIRSRRWIAPLLALLCQPAQAQTIAPNAAPMGGRVVGGSASISQTPTTTTINQSTNRGIINWQSFNVGQNQSVQFQQPSAQSMTLNRVVTSDPSVVAGRITANGGIAIVNQSGVFFAHGSQVQAQSVIVSTADIGNKNFMAGGAMNFNKAGNANATIVNNGDITVRQAGLAALVAPQVVNHGVIQARLGTVVLAGATTHVIDLNGDGLVSFDVTGAVQQTPKNGQALVTNTGIVQANGGTVELTAAAADGVIQNLVRAGGHIQANTDAATGTTGHILLQGTGGSISVAGNVSAQGKAAGTQGGTIQAVADYVQLQPTARLNASGKTGGGTIAIGTTLPGATTTQLAKGAGIATGATIKANATANGNGGHVIINSSEQTLDAGAISVRGGPQGGNGGLVELSGQNGFIVTGTVDATAPAGHLGSLVIDPATITVVADGDDDINVTGFTNGILQFTDPPTNAVIGTSTIGGFAADLTLQATNSIDIEAPITKPNGALTLDTEGTLTINFPITLSTGTGGNLGLSGVTININATLTANTVTLTPFTNPTGAVGVTTVTENPGGSIIAGTVTDNGAFFDTITLGGPNQINTIGSLDANQTVTVTNTKSLDVATEITSESGITLNVQGGDLTIDGNVQSDGPTQLFASGNVIVSASGSVVGDNGTIVSGVTIAAGYNFNTGATNPASATSITLNGLVIGGFNGDGTFIESNVALSAGTGGITEGPLGSVQANLLTVQSGGNVTLTAVNNDEDAAGNIIGMLGASNVQGNFSLTASGIEGEGTELIALDGIIGVSGTLNLQATNTGIIQNTGSQILAGTLIAGADGDITLTGENQVNLIGEIDSNAFTFHNQTDLQVAGPINAFADVSIASDGNLLVSGNILAQDASIFLQAGGNLTLAASATLTTNNEEGGSTIELQAATPTTGFDPTLPGSLTLAGVINAENDVILQAGTGGITQTQGSITGQTLSVQSGGDALLNQGGQTASTPNSITGAIQATVPGDFEFDNGSTDITISAPITSGTIGLRTTGTLNITSGCSTILTNCIVQFGSLNAGSGRVSLQVGDLTIQSSSNTITGGLVEIASATPEPLIAGDAAGTTVAGSFMVNQDILAAITSTTLRLGAATFDGATTTTAGGLSLDGTITLPNALDLHSLTDINQTTAFAVGTLSGAAGGNINLTMAGNTATTIGDLSAGGTLGLTLAGEMSLAGNVEGTTVNLIASGNIAETNGGIVTANLLTLNTPNGSAVLGGNNLVNLLGTSTVTGALAINDTSSFLIVPIGNTVEGTTNLILVNTGDLTINGTATGGITTLRSSNGTLTVHGESAIAQDGELLLSAPNVVTTGTISAASEIIVDANTATLGGTAQGQTLAIQAPSITFDDLDAHIMQVVLRLGTNGSATGSLSALGLTVNGGSGVTLTGSIDGVTTGAAAAIGVRATAQGVILGNPPPNANSFTFNGCDIASAVCTVVTPPGSITQRLSILPPVGAASSPLTILAQGNPRQFDETLTANWLTLPTPPPIGLFVQPTRDQSEDLELAPPNIRSEDF